MIGYSAASIHCTCDLCSFYNRWFPGPDEKCLIVGDGRKMEVEYFDCIGRVMHCDEDVEVTLRDVAFVPGVLFDLCSFNVIQEEHLISLDRTEIHMVDGRVIFRQGNVRQLRLGHKSSEARSTPRTCGSSVEAW